ncbi:hypothetical protein CCUS01_02189 [Colletotrichum cuscutae]|uniref:Uncharacterized protein n=1 Tax=Colletotrichum cuscutae TaxID=1209917 RepID=A0AAI9XJZ9_9PEZI|nr:hypothetical protein CCUS01_02189 [Colletotrichum cuscutae]
MLSVEEQSTKPAFLANIIEEAMFFLDRLLMNEIRQQATRKTTSRDRVLTSSILKMEADRHNILAATPEAPRLRRERLSRFFGDKDGPITISVEPLDTSERRQRAQADIDGIFAGLAYLDKRRDSLDTADTNPQSEQPLRENSILNVT